jgi:hypothetical protein
VYFRFISLALILFLYCPMLPADSISLVSIDSVSCSGSAACTTTSVSTGEVSMAAEDPGRVQGDYGSVCVQGYCGGESGPATSPFTTEITGASLLCFFPTNDGGTPCDPFQISFSLTGDGLEGGKGLALSLTGSLDQVVVPGLVPHFHAADFQAVTGTFYAKLTDGLHTDEVFLPFAVDAFGEFAFSASKLGLTAAGQFQLLGTLTVDNLGSNYLLNLPSSASISIVDAVPEPSTGFLVFGCAIAIVIIHRRRSVVGRA